MGRAAVGNAYAKNKRLPAYKRVLSRGFARVLFVTEAQWLGRVRRYSRHAGKGRRAGEVAIYILLGLGRVLNWWNRKVTEDVGGYAHSRYITVVIRWTFAGPEAYICVHANPGRRGAPEDENEDLMEEVEEITRRLLASDPRMIVLIGGDGNRRMEEERDKDHPANLCSRLGGEITMSGVDFFIVVGPAEITKTTVVRKPPGSNHPIIRATYKRHKEVKNKKRRK